MSKIRDALDKLILTKKESYYYNLGKKQGCRDTLAKVREKIKNVVMTDKRANEEYYDAWDSNTTNEILDVIDKELKEELEK